MLLFSIYDTARGLFWNIPEKQLKQYANEQKLVFDISNCKSYLEYSKTNLLLYHKLGKTYTYLCFFLLF